MQHHFKTRLSTSWALNCTSLATNATAMRPCIMASRVRNSKSWFSSAQLITRDSSIWLAIRFTLVQEVPLKFWQDSRLRADLVMVVLDSERWSVIAWLVMALADSWRSVFSMSVTATECMCVQRVVSSAKQTSRSRSTSAVRVRVVRTSAKSGFPTQASSSCKNSWAWWSSLDSTWPCSNERDSAQSSPQQLNYSLTQIYNKTVISTHTQIFIY